MDLKLDKHVMINGTIHCLTGLRIGGSKETMDIGNVQSIIRHPITNHPYIPGSSIKGKMRSLLEYKYSSKLTEGPCKCGGCAVCELFGSFGITKGPTRVLVRDAALTEDSLQTLLDAQVEIGVNMSEEKIETAIDRKSGRALNKTLRTLERVPAGTMFAFAISIRKFSEDNEKELVDFVLEGMELLQKDYLGGSGGRGYGQIEFVNVTIDGVLCDRFKLN